MGLRAHERKLSFLYFKKIGKNQKNCQNFEILKYAGKFFVIPFEFVYDQNKAINLKTVNKKF